MVEKGRLVGRAPQTLGQEAAIAVVVSETHAAIFTTNCRLSASKAAGHRNEHATSENCRASRFRLPLVSPPQLVDEFLKIFRD
jgi:hypothetical protein